MIADRPHPVVPTARWIKLHPTVQEHPCAGPVVYFVTNAEASAADLPQVVKIGTTVDLPHRMDRMQQRRRGFTARLVGWLPGGDAEEGALHIRFDAQRVGASGDWFWVAGPLLAYLSR